MIARLMVMFFVSGALALVYETVFGKLLSYVFGVTAFATSTVLASFMAGLALGGFALGRLADRVRRPLVGYAVLELLVGLYCLSVPTLFGWIDAAYAAAYHRFGMSLTALTGLRFTLSFLMILLPTFLMGGTLPMMARFAVRTESEIGRRVTWLYAMNTLGAAVGTLVCTYLLMPNLGIDRIIQFAAIGNALIFLWALAEHARVSGRPPETVAPPEEAVQVVAPKQEGPAISGRVLLLGAGLSGLVTLGYEVVWTHVLAQLVGTSVYAFGIMLFSFLVGLSLGAAYVTRVVTHDAASRRFLVTSQLIAAGLVVVTMPLWELAPEVFRGVGRLMERGTVPRTFAIMESTRFLTSFALLIGPTFFLGCAFPLLIRLYGTRVRVLGGSIGRMYFVNTLGAIVGSVAAGFLLLPLLKSQPTVRLLAGVNVAMAALFWWALTTPRGKWHGIGVLVVGAGIWLMPSWDLLRMNRGANVLFTDNQMAASGELEFHAEDLHGGVTAVTRWQTERCLWTNGKFEGNNTWEKIPQQHFAHYPCIYANGFERAITIGLGTGCTLGAMTAYPFERIDVCELSPNIARAARELFTDVNFGCLDNDDRVRLHVIDGRNHLRLHDDQYDVISVQVSSIWFAGAANLYNREFYELCRSRLKPDGVMQQWVQLHHQTARDLAVTLRTARQVFDHVRLFTCGQGVIVLSNRPLVADYGRVAELSARPRMRDMLSGFKAKTLFAILGTQIMDTEAIDRFLADAETGAGAATVVSSDFYPYLEYATPRNNALTDQEMAAFQEALAPYMTNAPPPVAGIPDASGERFVEAAFHYGRALSGFFKDTRQDNAAKATAALKQVPEERFTNIATAMRAELDE